MQERHNPSKTRLETVLSSPARPYPQVVVEGGTYWVDPSPDTDPDTSAPGGHKVEAKFEIDDSGRSYRAHFLGYDHQNFTAVDEEFGPVGYLHYLRYLQYPLSTSPIHWEARVSSVDREQETRSEQL